MSIDKKVAIFLIVIFIFISGCVDKNTIDVNTLKNETIDTIHTIKEKAPSDVCIKIDSNQSCISDVKNISINININKGDTN